MKSQTNVFLLCATLVMVTISQVAWGMESVHNVVEFSSTSKGKFEDFFSEVESKIQLMLDGKMNTKVSEIIMESCKNIFGLNITTKTVFRFDSIQYLGTTFDVPMSLLLGYNCVHYMIKENTVEILTPALEDFKNFCWVPTLENETKLRTRLE